MWSGDPNTFGIAGPGMLCFRGHWGVSRPSPTRAFSYAAMPLCRSASRARLQLIPQTVLLSRWGFYQAIGSQSYLAIRTVRNEGQSPLGGSGHQGIAMTNKGWGDLRGLVASSLATTHRAT
jgi:hypothetical protein